MYEKERFLEARKIVDNMARVNNGVTLVPGKWTFDKEVEEESSGALSVLPETRLNYSQISSNTGPKSITSSLSENEGSQNDVKVEPKAASPSVQYKESPLHIIRDDPVVLINLLIIMASWISTSFNNYLLGFSIRNFGGNLYYNSWTFGFASFFGKIMSSFLR